VYDENAFEITNWKEIDLFCYFSHNFVTIPPVTWVESSRRHGCRVLGTFITEWEAGVCVCVCVGVGVGGRVRVRVRVRGYTCLH
jgi:hypothetical protein